MTEINVALGNRGYPIKIGSGLLSGSGEAIAKSIRPTSAVVLSHPRLERLYAQPVVEGLHTSGIRTTLVTIPPGERFKNLRSAARLYDNLIDAGLDRKGVLITIGGGVLGDLGGFVAATYLRGVACVQIPTTLLAQVDSSIGGKTGVDLSRGKNLVGAFHQPRLVLIDTDTLRTLPARELRSGLAEVIKYGIIRAGSLFDRLLADLPRLLRRDPDALSAAIVDSCRIKAGIVEEDETEQGIRAILNFGHTVGHALETVTAYRRYKHGEAVAMGMMSASLIGQELGITTTEVTSEIRKILGRAGLPTGFPTDVDIEGTISALVRDKKAVDGSLTFVLPRCIGSVEVVHAVPQDAVRCALIKQRSPRVNLDGSTNGPGFA